MTLIDEVLVFGREQAPGSKELYNAVEKYIEKRDLPIRYRYYDMDTVDGLAEGAHNDVKSIPAIVVKEQGVIVHSQGRLKTPPSEEEFDKIFNDVHKANLKS